GSTTSCRPRSEAALHALQVLERLVEVLEERLQALGGSTRPPRDAIPEKADNARAFLQQRVALAQPGCDAPFHLLDAHVAEPRAAGTAVRMLLGDRRPPPEQRCRFDRHAHVAHGSDGTDIQWSSRPGIGVGSITTKAQRQGFLERFDHAWLVPRWTSTSPAFILVSPLSMIAQISPESTMA